MTKYNKEVYEANKEKLLADSKKYYQKHKEKVSEYQKKYRNRPGMEKKMKEYQKKYGAAYYQKHKVAV